MELPDNHHRRAVTVLILIVIVGALFFVGMKYGKPIRSVNTNRSAGIRIPANSTVRTTNTSSGSTNYVVSSTPVTPQVTKIDTVDVSGCKVKPAVANAKVGGAIQFLNKDAKTHVVSFGPKNSYVVPSMGEKTVLLDFMTMPGSWTYGCDKDVSAGKINFTK